MAEEKVSYLEPIEEGIAQEQPVSKENRESTLEKSLAPELQTEKKPEEQSESEAYQKILSSASTSTTTRDFDGNVDNDAQRVSLKTDADSKVSQLVDLAAVKGVVHAVKVARRLNDFYVLDHIHDDLANKLYESLKEKGMISE